MDGRLSHIAHRCDYVHHEITDRNRSVFLLGLRGLKQVTVLIKLLAVIVNVQLEPPFIRVR